MRAMTPVGETSPSLVEVSLFIDGARTPEELVELFSNDVWRFVSSQLSRREDAEDVVMEVFGSALKQFHKLERVHNHRLFLLSIARKRVADHLRRRYRQLEINAVPTATAEPTELHEAARLAIGELPAPQGQALVLKYVNGLSTEEVASVLRKSVAATNSLLQRARARLRDQVSYAFTETRGTNHEQL